MSETPVLPPAVGFLSGTLLAARIETVSIPACFLLVAMSLASRSVLGGALAFFALGLIHAEARWLEPRAEFEALDLDRPLEIVARINAHAVRRDQEILTRARTRYVSQRRCGSGRRHCGVRIGFDFYLTLPSEAKPPPFGATVRFRGYLKRSPGFVNTRSVRPGPWRARLKSVRLLKIETPAGSLSRYAGTLRHKVETALERVQNERRAGVSSLHPHRSMVLIRALVLGDRSLLPMEWQQVLKRLGLSHLLAVSGLHVGLLAALLFFVTSPLPRGARYLAILISVAAYVMILGPRPAVIRASSMGLLSFSALAFHRPPQPWNALAWSVFALVAPSPGVVQELGFQLSFAATAAILLLSPMYCERWRLLPKWVRGPLAVSFAAQVATLPILLPVTGSCHPLALVLNGFAVPWLGLFLLAAFPWLALAFVAPALGGFLLPVLDLLSWPIAALARWPPSFFELLPLSLPVCAAWAIAAALILLGYRPRLVPPVLLVVLALLMGGGRESPAPAQLVMLDVGQGDAILLRDGERALLVDGGGWPRGDLGGRVLVPALASMGVRKLDAVLLTHPDLDHCGGLADLVRYLPVAEIWTGPPVENRTGPKANNACVERLLAAPGPERRQLGTGRSVHLGRFRISVLHPGREDRGAANDLSVVLKVGIGGRTLLLTGDLEAAGESVLLKRWGEELRADVLKIAHHGSRSSTSAAWLARVAPRIALISAGPLNAYGHPSPQVLGRLEKARVRVLRTDLSGQIRLLFDDRGRILIDLAYAPRPGR